MATEEGNDLVKKEIEAWKGFEFALRKPNSSLFRQMLNECLENEEYEEAFKNKGTTVFSRIPFYGSDISTTKNDKRIT